MVAALKLPGLLVFEKQICTTWAGGFACTVTWWQPLGSELCLVQTRTFWCHISTCVFAPLAGRLFKIFLQCKIVNKNLRVQSILLVNNYYQAIICILYFGEMLIMGICVLLHHWDCMKGCVEKRCLHSIITAKRPLFLRAQFAFQTFPFLVPVRRCCKALGIFGEVFVLVVHFPKWRRRISRKLWPLIQAQCLKFKACWLSVCWKVAVGAGKGRVPDVGRVVEGIPQGASTARANKRHFLWDPNVWEELKSPRMWLRAGGWCHTTDCLVKLDSVESRTPNGLRFTLKLVKMWAWAWSPDAGFLWLQCFQLQSSCHRSGAPLLLNQVVSQNSGHADCRLARGKTRNTLMQFYVFTKKVHQPLDTAVSKTSRISYCSHFEPLSASPLPKAISVWHCHWAYLNQFGFLLLFCAYTSDHTLFFFCNLHSVFSVLLLHDDIQPSLSSS